jgi:hypothetical protein
LLRDHGGTLQALKQLKASIVRGQRHLVIEHEAVIAAARAIDVARSSMPVGCSGVHHLNLAGNLVILPATVYTMDGALVLGSQLLGACQVACAALGAVVQFLNGQCSS